MPAGQIAGVLTMCTMLAICSATIMGKYLGDSEFHRSSRVSCLLLGLTSCLLLGVGHGRSAKAAGTRRCSCAYSASIA